MADSTVLLTQLETGQAQKEATANQLFDAMSAAASYGRHAETCAGLVWGYYGTRFGGAAVANGTNTCGTSITTYMVAHLTTGAVTFATTTTNWDTPATYGRCFKIVTGASAVVSYEDHRFGPLGIINAAAVAGSGDMVLASVQTVTGAKTFGSAGAVGKLKVAGTTSGAATIDAPAVAGTPVITLPGVTGTLATLAGTEALTDKTYNGNTLTAGTYTLTGTAGKTLTFSNSITLAGTDSTTMTFPPASASVGYINIPQNSQSTAYTTVLADQGKHLLHPAADTTARTFTIDSNANVACPVGTAITFVNENAAGVMTIAITSDTMRLAGAGTTGSRTLAANGIATALKVTTTSWIISGTNLT